MKKTNQSKIKAIFGLKEETCECCGETYNPLIESVVDFGHEVAFYIKEDLGRLFK